jgi:hypothetical protein
MTNGDMTFERLMEHGQYRPEFLSPDGEPGTRFAARAHELTDDELTAAGYAYRSKWRLSENWRSNSAHKFNQYVLKLMDEGYRVIVVDDGFDASGNDDVAYVKVYAKLAGGRNP